ncbi:MAG TPA: histidinol-phosphate transaminase [Candidatus Binatia bacterium]|nr:histidinol-phosphate transaminase [Candidatus Binatia bacterium]
MSGYFRKNIAALAGYVPGEQPRDENVIKLNTNENPYPPSPRVFTALRRAINRSLRLYPEPLSDSLRAIAATVYGVKPENILAGNGSDEILSILTRCLVGSQDRVAFPVPTYSLYDTLIAIQQGERISVDYPPDFSVPEALASQNAALTFLCNPNSPSGTLVSLQDIERLARAVSGILVIDEAYVDFAESEGASSLPLIKHLPNLVVLRTFSKSFSLAGMRIGLAFAPEEIISGMMKVKDSYNLNRLSLVAAAAALGDMPWMTRNIRRIQRSRRQLSAGLRKMGFYVYPSHANFVMARKQEQNLKDVYERLKGKKILVRYFDVPGLQDSLRISVGTPQEIRALLKEMKAIGNHSTA